MVKEGETIQDFYNNMHICWIKNQISLIDDGGGNFTRLFKKIIKF